MIYTVRAPFFPIFLSALFTPAKTVSIFVCNSKNDLETSTDWVGSRDTKWNCTAWGRGQLPFNHRCSNLSFWEILDQVIKVAIISQVVFLISSCSTYIANYLLSFFLCNSVLIEFILSPPTQGYLNFTLPYMT